MARVLIPLPSRDFDPTEAGVPWRVLTAAGHQVLFATPDGAVAQADPRMVTGRGLGPLAPVLRADRNGREAHAAMTLSSSFRKPMPYDDIAHSRIEAILLPGGHAPGMREYLENPTLQQLVGDVLQRGRPVAAICHGVLLAARARRADGQSALYGRRTTALTRAMELSAWAGTCLWLGNYYRTYPTTVQAEVTAALANGADFVAGPLPLRRDGPDDVSPGFVLREGNYLSARWPGDAHRFAQAFVAMLAGA